MVWHTAKETFDPQCIIPTVKHGEDSVTVWGCFARRRIGKLHILDRTMDTLYYREILERNLLPSIANFGFSGGFACMHDNDLEHTSKRIGWLNNIRKYFCDYHTSQILILLNICGTNWREG